MNMPSKVTLYDMLAMVIPGFLLFMLFPLCCQCQNVFFVNGINEVYTGIFVFIVSYLIGLIHHKAVECLFTKFGFRNNEKCIENSARRFYYDYDKNRDNTKNRDYSQYNCHEYFKAYYTLMKEGTLNSIPALEAQVAFIRNILPITLLYVIAICCCGFNFNINPCSLVIFLFVISIVLVVILINIQNKIYYLVWEGNEYLKVIKYGDNITEIDFDFFS
jgi:hypothetical protein